MASVMTMGEMPSTAIPTPLTRPISMPTASTIGNAQINGPFWPLTMPASRMPQSAIVHGTDRSRPPVRMTVP